MKVRRRKGEEITKRGPDEYEEITKSGLDEYEEITKSGLNEYFWRCT